MISLSQSIVLGLLNGNWEYFPEAEQSAAQFAVSIYESYLNLINSTSNSKQVKTLPANVLTRFNSFKDKNDV
jgi:hypothetical protein